eukprot:gene33802-45269_t
MDTAFGGMPDAVWLSRVLPKAHVVSRSNNRDIQARMCALGAGVAVLPRPLGDGVAEIELIDLGEEPPGRDTFVGYHRDLKRLARLRALLDLVIARLASPGASDAAEQKPPWQHGKDSLKVRFRACWLESARLCAHSENTEPGDHFLQDVRMD